MANILISYFSESGEAMYDAVSDTLLNNGNNVFRLNINNESVNMTSWGGISKTNNNQLLSLIEQFKPELILNYNNSLPLGVEKVLDKSCINCLIDADNANYFWNKKYNLSHKDDYVYIGLQSASKQVYEKYIDGSLDEDINYIYLPGATVITKSNESIDKNITFIGTNFHLSEMPYQHDYYSESAKQIYSELKSNYYLDADYIKSKYPEISDPNWILDALQKTIAGQIRLKCLQSVSDLGLTIYGIRWENIAYYDYEMVKCISSKTVKTIEENQYVYNTSKIALNISHPQATTSFSWRVMDIMASNACLLTEPKQDWFDLFGEYLSNETINSIIYHDQYDLRAKTLNLLNDEDLRKKCVNELNDAIDNNGRWEKRFQDLSKIVGIKLIGVSNTDPSYIFINQKNNPVLNSKVAIRSNENKHVEDGSKIAIRSNENKHVEDGSKVRKKNIIQNGIYKVSHVPAIRKHLKDILEP